MTKEEIIEMAIQAGFPTDYNGNNLLHAKEIQVFAKSVAEKEREECAKTAENISSYDRDEPEVSIAKAIRARIDI